MSKWHISFPEQMIWIRDDCRMIEVFHDEVYGTFEYHLSVDLGGESTSEWRTFDTFEEVKDWIFSMHFIEIDLHIVW